MVSQLNLFDLKPTEADFSGCEHKARVQAMHGNSLLAFRDRLNTRRRTTRVIRCFEYIREHEGCIDLEVMSGLDFKDRNKVSPRITDLKNNGIVEECGQRVIDQDGHKVSVRRVRVAETFLRLLNEKKI